MIYFSAGLPDREVLRQPVKELLRRQTVEIADESVVVKYPQLALRETYSHEIIIFLSAGMVRILRPLLGAHPCGSGSTMVPVGDIEGVYMVRKDFGDPGNLRLVVNHPELMAESVFVCELEFRRPGNCFGDYRVQVRIVLVGEKDRLDVRILDADMDHAVILLVLARKFMLLDDAVGIVISVRAEHKAVLGAFSHSLCIYIIAWLRVADEPSVTLPFLEILYRLVVDSLVMVGQNGVEIYFRFRDMEQRFLSGHIFSFLGIQDIIRRRSHLRDNASRRTKRRKRFNSYHIL